jgi:hypothetical protein
VQNQIVNNLSICLPFAKSNCQPFVLLCKIKLSTICQFACNLSICSLQNQIVNNLSICSLQNQIVNNLSICRLQNQIVNNLSICRLQNQIVNNLSIVSCHLRLQKQIVSNFAKTNFAKSILQNRKKQNVCNGIRTQPNSLSIPSLYTVSTTVAITVSLTVRNKYANRYLTVMAPLPSPLRLGLGVTVSWARSRPDAKVGSYGAPVCFRADFAAAAEILMRCTVL